MEHLSNPLVSILIPVYNSEKTLDSCVQSVLAQSFQNFEIVLINDGSTDNSLDMMRVYESQDSRVIVVDKPHEGLLKARQSGIKASNGKYIQYLDSDDTLRKDALMLLTKKAEETQADMVVAPFLLNEGGAVSKKGYCDFTEISSLDYLKKVLSNQTYWAVWSRLHLRSLYSDDIEFPSLVFGEDVVLSTQLLLKSNNIVSIDYPIIEYNFTPSSCSHPARFDDNKYKDLMFYWEWENKFIESRNLVEELKEELAFFNINVNFIQLHQKKDFRTVNQIMKDILKAVRSFPNIEHQLFIRHRKVIWVYRFSKLIGYLNIRRYQKQGKI